MKALIIARYAASTTSGEAPASSARLRNFGDHVLDACRRMNSLSRPPALQDAGLNHLGLPLSKEIDDLAVQRVSRGSDVCE